MKKSENQIALAVLFTIAVPAVGYLSFGIWPALLFFVGYFSGFLLWIFLPTATAFSEIKILYWLTFIMFIVHRIEEKVSGFFAKLSEITNIPVPEVNSLGIIALVLFSVGGWLYAPRLFGQGNEFGKYLVWSFLASMGVTELAHFILPFFTNDPFGYFPGMLSVLILAPVAWFTMWKMTKSISREKVI